MPRIARGIVTAVLVGLLYSAGVTPALAAQAATQGAPLEALTVVLHQNDNKSGTLVVTGTLAKSVKLPATIQLAVPQGSGYGWAGQILGGTTSKDPEAKYTKDVRGIADVYTFTLTKSRRGQVEVLVPHIISTKSGVTTVDLATIAVTPTQLASLLVQVPSDATITQPVPGATLGLMNNDTYYGKQTQNVAAGTELDLKTVYTSASSQSASAAATTTSSSTSGTSVWVIVAVGLGVLAVIGLVAYATLRKPATTDAESDAPSGEGEGSDGEA